jgi:hypothetical protein
MRWLLRVIAALAGYEFLALFNRARERRRDRKEGARLHRLRLISRMESEEIE